MKQTEFRKLVREEIKATMAELDRSRNLSVNIRHIAPFKGKITQMAKQLMDLNKEIEQSGPMSEEIQDAVDSLMNLVKNL